MSLGAIKIKSVILLCLQKEETRKGAGKNHQLAKSEVQETERQFTVSLNIYVYILYMYFHKIHIYYNTILYSFSRSHVFLYKFLHLHLYKSFHHGFDKLNSGDTLNYNTYYI